MKGTFGVQKVVSKDKVESMYHLPNKPSGHEHRIRVFMGMGCGHGRGCGRKCGYAWVCGSGHMWVCGHWHWHGGGCGCGHCHGGHASAKMTVPHMSFYSKYGVTCLIIGRL